MLSSLEVPWLTHRWWQKAAFHLGTALPQLQVPGHPCPGAAGKWGPCHVTLGGPGQGVLQLLALRKATASWTPGPLGDFFDPRLPAAPCRSLVMWDFDLDTAHESWLRTLIRFTIHRFALYKVASEVNIVINQRKDLALQIFWKLVNALRTWQRDKAWPLWKSWDSGKQPVLHRAIGSPAKNAMIDVLG